MHKQVSFVQVAFHQRLILLSVLTGDYQIILRRYEPVVLLEPEYFTHAITNLLLLLSMLHDLFYSIGFGVLDGSRGRSLSLLLLFIRLFLDLEIFTDVHLRRDVQIDVKFDNRIEIGKLVLIILVGTI